MRAWQSFMRRSYVSLFPSWPGWVAGSLDGSRGGGADVQAAYGCGLGQIGSLLQGEQGHAPSVLHMHPQLPWHLHILSSSPVMCVAPCLPFEHSQWARSQAAHITLFATQDSCSAGGGCMLRTGCRLLKEVRVLNQPTCCTATPQHQVAEQPPLSGHCMGGSARRACAWQNLSGKSKLAQGTSAKSSAPSMAKRERCRPKNCHGRGEKAGRSPPSRGCRPSGLPRQAHTHTLSTLCPQGKIRARASVWPAPCAAIGDALLRAAAGLFRYRTEA